jgi:hypothetical protein
MLKLEEEARKAKEKRKKQEGKIHVQAKSGLAKLWNPRDPECIETMAFIRTIKPIDFSGLNAEIEDEMRKRNVTNKRHYKTLPELRSGF